MNGWVSVGPRSMKEVVASWDIRHITMCTRGEDRVRTCVMPAMCLPVLVFVTTVPGLCIQFEGVAVAGRHTL